MTDHSITAFFRDAGQPEAKTIYVKPGIVLALRLDEWARGAVAFVVTQPPNTVIVPPELVAKVRDVRARWAAIEHVNGAPVDTEAHGRLYLEEQRAVRDLTDAILRQMEGE